ncbi:hypothetical protein Daura_32315 [Dactylosporangium aurantiacum]|uniref:Uncharacterized protein n=1 Tax=Dactylosporangium aurantiacum TaxID=35754 RepID=A0A9Q9I8N7_9ACTN|nr:hypothetical protein [Dactylosporangium aurantiacum]MDG6107125.1 hypothetical protein [Dactylosporangium aurantiacum]UWZ51422.1 hypothetical protein Daura_32315 [Dactylosporangium aurantiacum]
MAISPCPDCGGRRVGAPTFAEVTPGRRVRLGTYSLRTGVTALICLECGRITHYIAELEKLRAQVEQHPEGFDH